MKAAMIMNNNQIPKMKKNAEYCVAWKKCDTQTQPSWKAVGQLHNFSFSDSRNSFIFEDTMTSLLKKVEQKTGKSGTWEHFTVMPLFLNTKI